MRAQIPFHPLGASAADASALFYCGHGPRRNGGGIAPRNRNDFVQLIGSATVSVDPEMNSLLFLGATGYL
jgi:hypothetical protein